MGDFEDAGYGEWQLDQAASNQEARLVGTHRRVLTSFGVPKGLRDRLVPDQIAGWMSAFVPQFPYALESVPGQDQQFCLMTFMRSGEKSPLWGAYVERMADYPRGPALAMVFDALAHTKGRYEYVLYPPMPYFDLNHDAPCIVMTARPYVVRPWNHFLKDLNGRYGPYGET